MAPITCLFCMGGILWSHRITRQKTRGDGDNSSVISAGPSHLGMRKMRSCFNIACVAGLLDTDR